MAQSVLCKSSSPNFEVFKALTTKELLSTLGRLANKQYVKLCGNATFKVVFDEWCILTVGALSKHYIRTRGPSERSFSPHTAWATEFSPLIYVLASGETTEAYKLAMKALVDCYRAITGTDIVQSVRQFHADLADSAEAARSDVFVNSVRVADYRHVIVAAAKLMSRYLSRGLDGECTRLRAMLSAMRLSRTHCTTLLDFHIFWAAMFVQLDRWGEAVALQHLQQEYFSLCRFSKQSHSMGPNTPRYLARTAKAIPQPFPNHYQPFPIYVIGLM